MRIFALSVSIFLLYRFPRASLSSLSSLAPKISSSSSYLVLAELDTLEDLLEFDLIDFEIVDLLVSEPFAELEALLFPEPSDFSESIGELLLG